MAANNQFHADIDAIVEADITTGFQDGTYRPSDPVTRQAMAAFMHRGFGRAGFATFDAPMTASIDVGQGVFTSNNVYVPVRSLTFTPPGATSGFAPYQFVLLHGVVTLNGKMDATSQGCPCQFTARIRDVSSNAFSLPSTDTFVTYSPVSAGFGWSFTVDAMTAAGPELGTRMYVIEAALGYRDQAAQAASFPLSQYSSLTAMSFPFGRNGTNVP